jgi:rhodanese-related sulfurtransferase
VKFFLDNWPLFLLALTSGAMLFMPQFKRGGGQASVGPGEAVRLINREKGVLIDVSEPAEYAASHANGAKNIPLGQIESSKDVPTNKSLPLIVMCATGARSSRAAALLKKAGHDKVFSLAGGTKAWVEAQLPISKGATS